MPRISGLSTIFPPAPAFTDKNLASLSGKVYVITGAASGVGFELAKILYLAGGTVYVAARSAARCSGAIEEIQSQTHGRHRKRKGRLGSMVVDLSDLRTIKPAVEAFLERETRLDVLVHNAGVMTPPEGSKDKLGHDLEIGVNCLAPYLLTVLLTPLLIRTASVSTMTPLSVRIVWVTTIMERATPPGGMLFDGESAPRILTRFMANYGQSKVGSTWLADEFAKRLGSKGILSVSLHPGLMRTDLQRHWNFFLRWITAILFKGPVYGAYSELYASFSPEVKAEHNGGYLMAWGRIADLPDDIVNGTKTQADGGNGAQQKFVAYCDNQTKDYV